MRILISSKFIFSLIMGGLILGLSIFILLAKQPDTLSIYVPKDSNFYLHFNPAILTKLKPEIRTQLKSLANKTMTIDIDELKKDKEVGIFYYKNNYFVITPETKQTFNKPAAEHTFRKPRRFFDFSEFQLYLNRTPAFLANFVAEQTTPTVLYGTTNQDSLCIYGSAPKLLKKSASFINNTAILDKKISANGLLLNKTLPQPTNQLAQSLSWLFINNLVGPLEVQIAQNNDFIIGFDSNSNDLSKIKQIVSFFYPKEVKKTLLDSTIATHFISDPNIFTEKQTTINNKRSSTLLNGSVEILHLLKFDKKTFATNNAKLLNSVALQPITTAAKVDIFDKNFKFTFDYTICGKLRVCID